MIVSYNASTVKIYNATKKHSAFLEKKNIFHFLKNYSAYYYAGIVVVNSKVLGMTPGNTQNNLEWNIMKKITKFIGRLPVSRVAFYKRHFDLKQKWSVHNYFSNIFT
jgi:hypothetical protein